MGEQPGRDGAHALVSDEGQWYELGTLIHLERTPSGPAGYRLVPDLDGDREVLGCRRVEFKNVPILAVLLRRLRH